MHPIANRADMSDNVENAEAEILALEQDVVRYANARRAVSDEMQRKMVLHECFETERLEHNRLISQEIRTANKRMDLIMSMHRSTRRETKYHTVE